MVLRTSFLLVTFAASAFGAWRVGRAEVDITPPAQMPMAGYYYVRLNEGTLDPLKAKAVVVESGGRRAALVALDLVQIPRPFVETARALIEKQTGIAGADVMISATHTHTGPELGSRLRGVTPETEALAKGYYKLLPEKIAESVRLASADLKPGRIRAAVGHEDSISFIRRYRMIDGSVGWNPGKLNPKIVAPRGTIDPDVGVLRFDDEAGAPRAAYVNFANHLDTVGGMAYSADYAFMLSEVLGRVLGPELTTLFTIGCAGNINHTDVRHNRPQKGPREAARIGAVLAGAALKAMEKLRDVGDGALRVSSETVALAPAQYPPSEVEKARTVVANYGKQNANPFLEQVQAFKVMDIEARGGKPFEAEVQVIALGRDVAVVGLPGEIFVEHGKAIKTASPFPVTIIAELANGNLGYVPDRKAYAEGAYEVVSTRLAEGSGEAMAASAVIQLVALFNGQ